MTECGVGWSGVYAFSSLHVCMCMNLWAHTYNNALHVPLLLCQERFNEASLPAECAELSVCWVMQQQQLHLVGCSSGQQPMTYALISGWIYSQFFSVTSKQKSYLTSSDDYESTCLFPIVCYYGPLGIVSGFAPQNKLPAISTWFILRELETWPFFSTQ